MARSLVPDDRLSHYRIVGPLGAGGMGEVYIAQDETLERSVALKILPPGLVSNDERVRRFVTEAKSASSLNHPNIVTIYEIGRDRVRSGKSGAETGQASEPVHFITMELVSGETLDQKIHQERTDLRTLLGYLAQATEGVAKAHSAGIVHRDLKPGNIMVSRDGFAKVLDFGLAKLTERQAAPVGDRTTLPTAVPATGEGVVMGTVGYMSPEQVQARTVDHRSDIFSVGCILYEAATRCRPFDADSEIESMHRILKDKPRPIEELNPEVPGAVRRIVRRCLAKSPDQRFQSMKDLAIELRELVEEWDSLSPSTPSGLTAGAAPLRVASGRGPAFWAIVAAASLLGLGGLGFGLYTLSGRAQTAGAGASSLQDLRMSILMSRNDLALTALSADGRYLAYVTFEDRTSSLKVRQVRTGSDVVIIPSSETPIIGISFSPDGDYLFYRSRDPDTPNYSALFQVASLGGASRKVFFDVDSAATFSPDGRLLCFRRGLIATGVDTLVIGDRETGKERELARVSNPERFVTWPSWSPDGKSIAVGIQSTRSGVKTWLETVDVENGRRSPIGTHTWIAAESVRWLPDGSAVLVSAFDLGAGIANQIYRVAYPGGQVLRLTNDLDGYTDLSIAADGSSIAATRRANVDNLWVYRADSGKEPQAITFASGSAGSIGLLEPLPGGAVAFSAPKESKVILWRIATDGSDRRQLTTQGVFVQSVAYSTAAGLLFTQVDGPENVVTHIWRVDPDGGGLRQVTEGSGEQMAGLSPMGGTLIFTRWGEPGSIWALKLDGGQPYKLVDGRVVDQPLVSPDGTRVLAASLEDINGRSFPRRNIIPAEGGAPLASFLLPPGAANIQWAPDGRSLFYVDRGQGSNLMRKPLPEGEPEPVTRFTDGQVVAHNWSRDGSRMAIHRRVGRIDSLWMLERGKAQPTMIVEFKTGRLTRPVWAPDEPILYFTYGTSTQDVVLMSGVK